MKNALIASVVFCLSLVGFGQDENTTIEVETIPVVEKPAPITRATLPPFQLLNPDTLAIADHDEIISGSYSAAGMSNAYDAVHAFNYRRSDKFGGYINGKINDGLKRIRDKGYKSDIKALHIQIDPATLTVYWTAVVGPSTDGYSYTRVDSRGSAGGGPGAVQKQLDRMHSLYSGMKPVQFLDFNENVTRCFSSDGSPRETCSDPINIRQWFYKYR